jgi:hypothetical protein
MPSNAGYYHAAYIVAAVVYIVYAWSIIARTRALRVRAQALPDARDVR